VSDPVGDAAHGHDHPHDHGADAAADAPARPLLLLDVDGVLLVGPSVDDLDVDADREPRIPPEAPEWLADLAEEFELCWATTWEEMANAVLAPRLGLPPLPAVHFDLDTRARTVKLPSVIAFAGERPLAWIDDDLHEDAFTWAAGRRAPTLLVPCTTAEGMARRHVDRMLAFAAELGHDSERRRS
jgi:hypothetical protein